MSAAMVSSVASEHETADDDKDRLTLVGQKSES